MSFGFALSGPGLTFYQPAFEQFLNATSGEIGVNFEKKIGRPIYMAARRDVGVDTGRLRNSIYMIHSRGAGFQEIRIGAADSIALLHHNGSRPHEIDARGLHVMRFSSRGRQVYSRVVHHPGTRANPFLAKNLYLAYV